MSFSGEVKEELIRVGSGAKRCQLAELAALLVYGNAIQTDETGNVLIELQSDALYIAKRSSLLLGKIFQTEPDSGTIPAKKVLQAIRYTQGSTIVDTSMMESQSSRRAFLRGAFLATGSISNPQKGYHLEFVCITPEQAGQIIDMLAVFEVRAKTVTRKKYQVVYIKESEEIVELLNIIGAHIALMNLENMRIFKDMRNTVNRKVNCEMANITKTVNAATKQIEDIQYIKEHYGFDNLPENLREIAQLRLEYPEATLKELGEYLTPVVGKSGVNHRLRKLSEIKNRKG